MNFIYVEHSYVGGLLINALYVAKYLRVFRPELYEVNTDLSKSVF